MQVGSSSRVSSLLAYGEPDALNIHLSLLEVAEAAILREFYVRHLWAHHDSLLWGFNIVDLAQRFRLHL
ncbi:hypothetical protein M422DRAFT_37985, partial [Sphaerobolus stellatus SS14]